MTHLCCFFKQNPAYEMRISDWSSDVCSSDLRDAPRIGQGRRPCEHRPSPPARGVICETSRLGFALAPAAAALGAEADFLGQRAPLFGIVGRDHRIDRKSVV